MPKGIWWGVDIASFCAFLGIWAIILTNYGGLPETIPTHFGLNGQPDGFGNKSMLLFLLAAKTFTFVLLSATPFYPNLINIPGARTAGNIRAAIAMVRIVKLEVVAFFLFLAWSMVGTAQGRAYGLGPAPLIFVALLLATIAIGLYASTRNEI